MVSKRYTSLFLSEEKCGLKEMYISIFEFSDIHFNQNLEKNSFHD